MKIELKVERFDAGSGSGECEYVTLRAYEELLGEMGALRADVIELRKNKALLTSEVEEIARIRAEHRRMMDEQNELALFLREHYKDEIALGQHGGMTLVQTITRYLGRERMQPRDRNQQSQMMEVPPARVAKIKRASTREGGGR